MSWFGTSNPELSDPFYGIRAGHTRRRNAQRRRSKQNLAGMYGVAQMQQRRRQPRSVGVVVGPNGDDDFTNGTNNNGGDDDSGGDFQIALPTNYSNGTYFIKAVDKPNITVWRIEVTNRGNLVWQRNYGIDTVGNLNTDFEQLKLTVNSLVAYEAMSPLQTTYPNYVVLLTVDAVAKSNWADMPQKSFRVVVGRGDATVYAGTITNDYQIALEEYQTQVDLLGGDPGYYDIPDDPDNGGSDGGGGDFTDDDSTDNGTTDNGTTDNGTTDTSLTFNNEPTSTYQHQTTATTATTATTSSGTFPYLPMAGVVFGALAIAYVVTR